MRLKCWVTSLLEKPRSIFRVLGIFQLVLRKHLACSKNNSFQIAGNMQWCVTFAGKVHVLGQKPLLKSPSPLPIELAWKFLLEYGEHCVKELAVMTQSLTIWKIFILIRHKIVTVAE